MWSVAPVSKIQKLGCLPSGQNDLEVKVRGVLQITLALRFKLGCDFYNKPGRLWYFSLVKPKDLEYEESAPFDREDMPLLLNLVWYICFIK